MLDTTDNGHYLIANLDAFIEPPGILVNVQRMLVASELLVRVLTITPFSLNVIEIVISLIIQ